MKRKTGIGLAFFCLLLFSGWSYLDLVFASEHPFKNTAKGFYELAEQTNIDVLFLGSSHIYTAVNPHIINQEANTISYNLGTDGMRLEFSNMVLKQALKHTQPKLVVVEVFRGSLEPVITDESKGFQLRALDFASNLSATKWQLTKNNYNFNEIAGVYSPLVRNHKNWHTESYFDLENEQDFSQQTALFYDGYYGARKTISDADSKEFADFRVKERSVDLSQRFLSKTHKEALLELVALSERYGFSLMMQTSPDLKAASLNNALYQELADFCKQNEIPYFDMNSPEVYSALDLKVTDFKDASHLNIRGSEKTSAMVAKFINENFELSDRSEENIYLDKAKEFSAKFRGEEVFALEQPFEIKDAHTIESLVLKRAKHVLNFRITFKDSSANSDRYKLGIHLYPKEGKENQLHEESKAKGRNFDIGTGLLEDTDAPLEVMVFSSIDDLDRIRIFLYDRSGYKGVVGKVLQIREEQLNLD